LLRLQQLPTTEILDRGAAAAEFGLITTVGGQRIEGGGGTGNQTYYGAWDLGVHRRVMLSGFFSFNDDPTWGLVAGRRLDKKFADFGSGLRVSLGEVGPATFTVEGSLARFGMRSEGGLFTTVTTCDLDYFAIGTISAMGSVEFARRWRVTLTPSLIHFPKARTGVEFFGWTTLLGAGVDGEPLDRWRVFATAELLLGPGSNFVDADLSFQRTPLWSVGWVYEPSPKTQLTGYLTNQSGGTPPTRHLILQGGVPVEVGARLRYTPSAPERERPHSAAERGARALPDSSGAEPMGGIQGIPAQAIGAVTVHATVSIDASWSRSLLVRVGVSDELDFELALGRAGETGALPRLQIPLSEETEYYRVGAKLTLASEEWGFPVTVAARLTGGQNYPSKHGYFMAEVLVRRQIRDWVQVTVAPVLALNAADTPVALGMSGVFGPTGGLQLILEPMLLLTGQPSLWTAGVRLPEIGHLLTHAFVSTARSTAGIGRLLGDPSELRVGVLVRARMRLF
jgi:hypothetical protein